MAERSGTARGSRAAQPAGTATGAADAAAKRSRSNPAADSPPNPGRTSRTGRSTGTQSATGAGRTRAGRAANADSKAPARQPEVGASVKAPPIAAEDAAKGATMAKPARTRASATKAQARRGVDRTPETKIVGGGAARSVRPAAEVEKIREALTARLDELRAEYASTRAEITELQRDRLIDSAGDDQADTGTKTFEREQEISLANSILERVTQVERALERLAEGNYGWCERCGNAIPVERLAAFPSATLCVTCKQLEERR